MTAKRCGDGAFTRESLCGLVEVAPAYDWAQITALAGASLAYEYLCLLAAKRPERAGA